MGKLWWDVYWLYTVEMLPRYNGSVLYIHLYVGVLYVHTCRGHPGYFRELQGAPGNIQGNGHVCTSICMCVWNRHHDYWRLLLIWPQGHSQLHCWPSEWFCVANLVPVFHRHMNIDALIRHRKLGFNSFLKKMQSYVSAIVSLVDWSFHVNAIHLANCDMISCKFIINQIRDFETAASQRDILNIWLAPATACESQETSCHIEISPDMPWISVNYILKENMISMYWWFFFKLKIISFKLLWCFYVHNL